jgi:hypothetical protein
VGLGVGGRGHVVPHVQHDDLLGPGGPLRRPAGGRPEDPGQVPSRVLERQPVIVERLGQPEVVEQRRDVVQLVVEGDPVRPAVHHSPEVGADAVVEQRGRVETGGHGQGRRGGGSLRKHQISLSYGRPASNPVLRACQW